MSGILRALGHLLLAAAVVGIVLLAGVPRATSFYVGGTARAAWPPQPFTVALVWPSTAVSFAEGVTMAGEEINASDSPLAGKLRLAVIDEDRDEDAIAVAQRVVARSDVVAVLGHEFSASAVPASMVYDHRGLIFLAPTATAPLLTEHQFRTVFRLTPDDTIIAAAHAEFAKRQGFSKVAVFFARTEGGESAGAQFISHMRDAGIGVVYTRSYIPRQRDEDIDFRPLIAEMDQHELDAVMIADQLPRAASLIVDLRKMGYGGPILGSDKLADEQVWALSGGAAQDLYVASAVDPSALTPAYVAFHERFLRRWKEEPSYIASQGYDALQLLTEAMVTSQAVDPLIVATTLRSRSWDGLFGDYSFALNGDIKGRQIFIKRMDDGHFVTVSDGKAVEP
jgi:branched-chain amino acid transport system substrate-binding protein